VADSLMLGCQPIIVEGCSDQHFLTAMKTLLIASGRLAPTRELIFPPSGGTKNTKMVASILTGRDEELPYVILDGDFLGQKQAKELRSSLYKNEPYRVLSTDNFTDYTGSEIEDLIPGKIIAYVLDRMERNADKGFGEVIIDSAPIVGQIENWARNQEIVLQPGWKVELAKRVKQHLLAKGTSIIPADCIDRWFRLFQTISGQSPGPSKPTDTAVQF
jgi:hypothetical protein